MNDDRSFLARIKSTLPGSHKTMNAPRFSGLSTRSFLQLAIFAVFVGLPQVAQADLPRPPGWEPTCTLEKEQNKGGGPCEHCRGWQDPDPCQKALEDKGYTRRCTEGGAGSYVAVWCKGSAGPTSTAGSAPPSTPPTTAPAADNRRGGGICSVQVIGQDKHDAQAPLLTCLGIGLALVRRRVVARRSANRSRTE